MTIQIILFDIGGVFFKWKDRWLFNNIANKFGLSEVDLSNECKKELPNLVFFKLKYVLNLYFFNNYFKKIIIFF